MGRGIRRVTAKCALGHEWPATSRESLRKSRKIKDRGKRKYFAVHFVKPGACPVCGRRWQQLTQL